jgi:hypothetical protein
MHGGRSKCLQPLKMRHQWQGKPGEERRGREKISWKKEGERRGRERGEEKDGRGGRRGVTGI